MESIDRRTILKTIGAGVALGTTTGVVAAQDDDEEPDYGEWFDDVENYEETEDLTDDEEVTVEVGTGDDGFEFEPPAIRISQETTVTWEWTGEGGVHNVVHAPEDEEEEEIDDATEADEPVFESDLEDEEGVTFEHDFEDDEPGTYLYVCEPHRTQGMKGAVVLEE
ncbi:halocyanin domain-containing protein [Natrononativus amylolyticus]|uniref:halocyanin domain-containing protein n=1 Tax=Natrononativus amylolyticus TaxID=2963434 RepID=UPI0020CBDDB7|nr:halocyanin domain-containing protein [Natrononativus amylolyticus]